MGVPGLWDVIAPAGRSRSLAKLAIDGFENNSSGKRAYRVGIDASIWYKHAAYSKGGENPELRLLFFRIKSLTRLPLLPLFVFDGRWGRPKMKRGNRVGKSGLHTLTRNLKTLLDIFGMEWREARGEAEAELAYLNSVGVIDAIMTDDVDAFLFGATTIIRNPSLTLSGNRSNPATNLDGKPSNDHVMEFRIEDILSHPEIQMSRGGMILFSLLTGGDYDNGVDKIGKVTAHALVRCGFGDELEVAILNRDVVSLHNFLPAWRERINTELRENRQGFLRRAAPGLCLPSNFPNLDLLDKYVRPERNEGGTQGVWENTELNLPQLAAFCEEYFEWGTRTQIIKRFRSLIWEASVIRVLRKAALEQDKKETDTQHSSGVPSVEIRHCRRPELRDAVGTSVSLIHRYLRQDRENRMDLDRRISAAFVNRGPVAPNSTTVPDDPKSLIVKIHGERRHVSTDRSLEYRIEVDPEALVQLVISGIKGTRPEQSTTASPGDDDDESEGSGDEGTSRKKKKPKEAPNPLSTFRMWCPASMIIRVNPGLIEEYERAQEEKKHRATRKASGSRGTASTRGRGRGATRRRTRRSDTETETETEEESSSRPSPQKRRRAVVSQVATNNASTGGPATRENPPPSVPISGSVSSPAGTRANLGSSANSASVSSGLISAAVAPRPTDPAPDKNANNAAYQAARSSPDVPVISLGSISTQKSRFNGDNWDANDSISLFLFSICDPCDPDFIEREDLRNRPPEPVFRWTDVSSGVANTYDREEDGGFVSDDGEMDRSFQRDFMRKAQETNRTYTLGTTKKATVAPVCNPDSTAPMRSLSVSTNKVNKRASQTSSSVPRPRQTSSAAGRNLPDSGHTVPLFLPPRSPPPVHDKQSSSPTKNYFSKSPTRDFDVIILDSSDEDYDLPSSSFGPPSSSISSSSPIRNGQINGGGHLASFSQDSGVAMCDGDDYLDLSHL